jgi:tRNA(fMet)-specific endonuclease VapC
MMLDTNICIYIIKQKPLSVKQKFESFDIGELCISSITVAELMYGVYKSQQLERNLQALERFLMPFEVLEFDFSAAAAYGKIRAALEKKGQVIGGLDMQIAGHAISLDMTVVTNNIKEFERVDGLMLENWV